METKNIKFIEEADKLSEVDLLAIAGGVSVADCGLTCKKVCCITHTCGVVVCGDLTCEDHTCTELGQGCQTYGCNTDSAS